MDWIKLAKLLNNLLPVVIQTVEALHPPTAEVPRKGDLKKAIVVGLVSQLFGMANAPLDPVNLSMEVDKTVQEMKVNGQL